MATRDFMIHDVHGHRITNQLTENGWEMYLLAPVGDSKVEFKVIAQCGSMGAAIGLAKRLAGGETVEQIAAEIAERNASKSEQVTPSTGPSAPPESPAVSTPPSAAAEAESEPEAIAESDPESQL